jgi:hypothetical protein
MGNLFLSGLKHYKWKREKMENDSTKINVTLGYTLNLGNFQSLRIDLGVVDSKRDSENIDEAFNRVYSFVEDKLIAKINDAKEEVNE